ncbi:MAG: MFS transporter, partial [Empedobacter falsenii]
MSTKEKQTSKPELSTSLLWIITLTTGIVVGNNYYNQPLLGLMAKDFNASEDKISFIAMLTQIGFALGLLFIVPLGDMMRRKRLVLSIFFFIIISLIGIVSAPSLEFLYLASFFIGFTSIIPQMLVPLTAELSTDRNRNSAIGMVMSGLLLGILLSRVIAGFIGELYGWRAIYYIAIGLMIILMIVLKFKLPDIKPSFKGNYLQLMKSLIHIFKTQPVLRLAAFRGALGFAAFSGFWITLVFLLEGSPFYASSSVAGAFGVIGAMGALAATTVGKLARYLSLYKIILYAIFMQLVSWIIFYFTGNTYIGLIVGVIILDLGLQSMHISNQASFFALKVEAPNRMNTVYMCSYFLGGSIGSYAAAQAWKYYKWDGVVVIGFCFTV